ncbi:MAG: siderophore biosynthesis protein SbnG [Deltaproteobacteria bacterium]|nr:siderophore biosynthesis protein SbnG [Deltaproteobacteria bacterium]
MMKTNRVKKLLNSGRLAVGQWVGLCDPAVVEIMALAGYDFVAIDLEHTMFDLQTVENMVRAAEATEITSLVRVSSLDPKMILRIMECGAQGVFLPHVRTADEVKLAVDAAKYWPEGDRGISGVTRAARYLAPDFMAHTRVSNEETMIIAMIEEAEAVERIDEILAVDGLDVAFIGPADLARSLGILGRKNHPRMAEAVDRVIETHRRLEKAHIGIACFHSMYDPPLETLINKGIRCVTTSPTDTALLLRACREQVQMAREAERK